MQVQHNLDLFKNPLRNVLKEVGVTLKSSKELAVLLKARHSITKNIMAATMPWDGSCFPPGREGTDDRM